MFKTSENKEKLNVALNAYLSKLGKSKLSDAKYIDSRIEKIEKANKEIDKAVKRNRYSVSVADVLWVPVAFGLGSVVVIGAGLLVTGIGVTIALGSIPATIIALIKTLGTNKESYLYAKEKNMEAIEYLEKMKKKSVKEGENMLECGDPFEPKCSAPKPKSDDPFSGEKYIDAYKNKTLFTDEELDEPFKPSNDIPENKYDMQSMWKSHLIKEMQYQNEMNAYISECCAIAEGVDPIGKIMAINEGVGDKARSIWNTVIGFIKKIYARFIERLSSWVGSNEWYLNKYKEIILKKPLKAVESVEMPDHTKGIARIFNRVVPTYSAADISKLMDTIQDGVDEDENTKNYIIKMGISEFKGDMKPAQFFTSYFKGGDPKVFTAEQLNLADMYEFCRDFSKVKAKLKADDTAVTRSKGSFESEMKKYESIIDKSGKDIAKGSKEAIKTGEKSDEEAKAARAKEVEARAKEKIETDKANAAAEKAAKDAAAKKVGTESAFIYSNVYNTYISEKSDAVLNTSSATGSPVNDTTGAKGTPGDAAGGAIGPSNNNQTQVAAMVVKGQSVVSAKDNPNNKVKKITIAAKIYFNTSSQMMGGKLSAIESIKDDYMKIIRAHIKYYVGDEEKIPNQSQAIASNNNGVKSGATQISDKEAENKKLQDDINAKAEELKKLQAQQAKTPTEPGK